MDKEKMFYNAIAIALNGNPSSVRILKKRVEKKYGQLFGSWQTVWERLKNHQTLPDPEKEWEILKNLGIRMIFRNEDEFPRLLREIHEPPFALYIRGVLEIEADKTLSIVGTRRATSEGKITTHRFARELADAGFKIVSGLALGIDAAAHKGCLESPTGKTMAVLAGGLDKFYPSENERLGLEIIDRGGAIISEYPIRQPPYPDRFLERNRIISGLSKGVLVIECPARSGSLATASYAIQQNRDLFIIPGPVTHSNFFGSHQLIRQGAELITIPEEILLAYGLTKKNRPAPETLATTTEEKQVLIALSGKNDPLEVDKIIELTKLEPRVVNQTLSFLLLKNVIKETGSGYIIE